MSMNAFWDNIYGHKNNKEMEDDEMFDFMYLTDMLIICIVRKRFNLAFIKLVN